MRIYGRTRTIARHSCAIRFLARSNYESKIVDGIVVIQQQHLLDRDTEAIAVIAQRIKCAAGENVLLRTPNLREDKVRFDGIAAFYLVELDIR